MTFWSRLVHKSRRRRNIIMLFIVAGQLALAGQLLKKESAGSPTMPVLIRTEVKRHDVQVAQEDLMTTLMSANLAPVKDKKAGKVMGYQFVSIEKGSLIQKVGFKEDDILQAVQGENISSPDQAMQIYQTLSEAKTERVRFDFLRSGKKHRLEVKVIN